MTLDDLRKLVSDAWLSEAEAEIRKNPGRAQMLYARAARKLGKRQLHPEWTATEAGRAVLLAAAKEQIRQIYEQGDANEKLAVLKALPLIESSGDGVRLLHDALRTNDTRLVAAALGPYAKHLDQETWRQGVIKVVFMGLPLSVVDRLDERADHDLARMLRGLADERAAAGREMPADATDLLTRMGTPS